MVNPMPSSVGSSKDLSITTYKDDLRQMRSAFSGYSVEELVMLRNVCFIHSCMPPGTTTRVLEELLEKLKSSGLWTQLGAVWVYHYGEALPVEFVQKYAADEALGGLVRFEHVSTDIARFEIPTIQRIQYFSKLVQYLRRGELASHSDTNVLYMHTKGVSYKQEPEQIRHWRELMTYFLVDEYAVSLGLLDADDVQQSANYSLLLSQHDERHAPYADKKLNAHLDAIGVNLRWNEGVLSYGDGVEFQYYSGNYWWARTSYLATLPLVSVLRNNKIDAEMWLGSGHGRLGCVFSSHIDHYTELFPSELYRYSRK